MGQLDEDNTFSVNVMIIGSDYSVSEFARRLAEEITENRMGFDQAYNYLLEEFGF